MKIKCPECTDNGHLNGIIWCEDCDGAGETMDYISDFTGDLVYSDCSRCGSTGLIECPVCKGKTFIEGEEYIEPE